MAGHWADQHIKKFVGPRGVVRTCTVCDFHDFIQKAPRYHAGRGWGLREGNKQRGRLIQHIKACHPELEPRKEDP